MAKTYQLGRKPRTFDPRVPHLSALRARARAVAAPPAADNTYGMPSQLGMMLNDRLGCCTASGFYHGRQVWTNHSGGMKTEPDDDVLKLYEATGGYNPNDPSSDQGAVEQDVLKYLFASGAPVGTNGARDQILSYVEIDPRNHADVQHGIYSTGFVYIGFEVPDFVLPDQGDPPSVWDDANPNAQIIGGHCVILPGYTPTDYKTISWGAYYQMTQAFFDRYVDEVYAISDITWTKATGRSLLNMSEGNHLELMKHLKNGA